VHLAVRDRHDANICREDPWSRGACRCHPRSVARLPLTCTAVRKALLASESAEVRNRSIGAADPPVHHQLDHQPQRGLARELDEIRRTGIAVEREEAAIGGCCLASPVLAPDDRSRPSPCPYPPTDSSPNSSHPQSGRPRLHLAEHSPAPRGRRTNPCSDAERAA